MKLELQADAKKVSGNLIHDDMTQIKVPAIDTADFLTKLDSLRAVNVGLLPPAVRWMSNDRRVVVFERPPMTQLVSYVGHKKEEINQAVVERYKEDYVLPIPWTVYVIGFNKDYNPFTIFVYTRPEALYSFNDPLYLLPLFNFYGNSELCPPTYEKYEGELPSLAAGINYAYNAVWNSGWNADLDYAIKSAYHNKSFFPVGKGAYTMAGYNGLLATWASKTIAEVLVNAKYIYPSPAKNSMDPTPLTLAMAIQRIQNLIAQQEAAYTRTFMVNVVNALF